MLSLTAIKMKLHYDVVTVQIVHLSKLLQEIYKNYMLQIHTPVHLF